MPFCLQVKEKGVDCSPPLTTARLLDKLVGEFLETQVGQRGAGGTKGVGRGAGPGGTGMVLGRWWEEGYGGWEGGLPVWGGVLVQHGQLPGWRRQDLRQRVWVCWADSLAMLGAGPLPPSPSHPLVCVCSVSTPPSSATTPRSCPPLPSGTAACPA